MLEKCEKSIPDTVKADHLFKRSSPDMSNILNLLHRNTSLLKSIKELPGKFRYFIRKFLLEDPLQRLHVLLPPPLSSRFLLHQSSTRPVPLVDPNAVRT